MIAERFCFCVCVCDVFVGAGFWGRRGAVGKGGCSAHPSSDSAPGWVGGGPRPRCGAARAAVKADDSAACTSQPGRAALVCSSSALCSVVQNAAPSCSRKGLAVQSGAGAGEFSGAWCLAAPTAFTCVSLPRHAVMWQLCPPFGLGSFLSPRLAGLWLPVTLGSTLALLSAPLFPSSALPCSPLPSWAPVLVSCPLAPVCHHGDPRDYLWPADLTLYLFVL